MMRRGTFPRGLMIATIAATCTIAMPPVAFAALLLYNESDPATSHRGDGPFTVGYLFQVGATPILINRLGVQDVDDLDETRDPDPPDNGTNTGFADDDGFVTAGTISVGLWTAGGTLLAKANVSDTDPVIDSWRYASMLTPADAPLGFLVLAANTQYLIGARVGAGIEFFLDEFADPAPTAFTWTSGITVLGNRYTTGAFPAAPTLDGTSTLVRWGAANAIFIPAPAALPAGLGLLTLATLRRRRR